VGFRSAHWLCHENPTWTLYQLLQDEEKDKILQLAGFTILRFCDEEVLNNLSQVEGKIMKWIEEYEKQQGNKEI
jgi:very-short-patch-repair endonuclease